MTIERQGGGRGFILSQQGSSPQSDGRTKAEYNLRTLGLATEIDRRKFLRNQNLPVSLYKFKSVNPEKPYILEDIIVNSKLYLSSPQSFNDLFDMKPHATVEGNLLTLLAKIKSLPAPSQKAKRDAMQRARAIWREHGLNGIANEYRIQETIESLFADTGVFCFSTISPEASRDTGPRNNLMWSHYGDSHGGVCLQFQVSKDLQILQRLVKVTYSDRYPTINWLSPRVKEECLFAATNKQTSWAYEHEWRRVQLNSARTYTHFNPCLLTGIILGAKITAESMTEVDRVLKMRAEAGLPPLRKYCAQTDRASYKIRILHLSS
jgi:hypothetical protein